MPSFRDETIQIINKQIMKKIYLLLLCVVISHVQSQTLTNSSLSYLDKDQIIQKCLTFQPLQDVIPTTVKDQMDTYQILNKAVDVTLPSTLIVAGKSTSLISEATIGTNKPFYEFHLIKVDGNKAFVRYSFLFNENDVPKKVQVHLEFEKKNSEWITTNNNYISDIIK
jgi:hypothetical protein